MTNRETLRKLRVAARAAGLCIECRKNAAKPGCVTCQACLDARSNRLDARVAEGLCPCGRTTRPDRYSCSRCLRANTCSRQRRREEDRKLKRCTLCRRNPAGPRFQTCTVCRATDRQRKKHGTLERRAA